MKLLNTTILQESCTYLRRIRCRTYMVSNKLQPITCAVARNLPSSQRYANVLSLLLAQRGRGGKIGKFWRKDFFFSTPGMCLIWDTHILKITRSRRHLLMLYFFRDTYTKHTYMIMSNNSMQGSFVWHNVDIYSMKTWWCGPCCEGVRAEYEEERDGGSIWGKPSIKEMLSYFKNNVIHILAPWKPEKVEV